jgi:biopolymer transport protein ExbD
MFRKVRKTQLPEINAGAMADIAFLLLIFFLLITTMDSNDGINRTLPPKIDKISTSNSDISKRNLFKVVINKQNQIYIYGKICNISEIRKFYRDFFLNLSDIDTLSEKQTMMIGGIQTVSVSKGIVFLSFSELSDYKTYLRVQSVLSSVQSEIIYDFAQQVYKKEFKLLEKKEQQTLIELLPVKISEKMTENKNNESKL